MEGPTFCATPAARKKNDSLLMDLKRENLCASCARIYECSACRPQQGEKITLGITSVSHVRRDYGCSSGYWRIFPRFQSYFWGRSKWTSFKTPTNPHQISSIKKDPMLEEELFARVLECIFLISFTLCDFRMGRQTPLHPHHPPSACGVRASSSLWRYRRWSVERGEGVREGEKTCIVD